MHRAKHAFHRNLLIDSSTHTSHLWMCWNSRIWGRDSEGKRRTDMVVVKRRYRRHLRTTSLEHDSQYVPYSTQFYTVQCVIVFKFIFYSTIDFQWVIPDTYSVFLDTTLFKKKKKTPWKKTLSHHFVVLGAIGNFTWFVMFFLWFKNVPITVTQGNHT